MSPPQPQLPHLQTEDKTSLNIKYKARTKAPCTAAGTQTPVRVGTMVSATLGWHIFKCHLSGPGNAGRAVRRERRESLCHSEARPCRGPGCDRRNGATVAGSALHGAGSAPERQGGRNGGGVGPSESTGFSSLQLFMNLIFQKLRNAGS